MLGEPFFQKKHVFLQIQKHKSWQKILTNVITYNLKTFIQQKMTWTKIKFKLQAEKDICNSSNWQV